MDENEMLEQCARTAHEINRAYCEAIGDTSQVPWDEAPDWQKASARDGALAALDPKQTPADSHVGWLRQKRADGWVFGDVKDPEKKTHPCMVEYQDLPQAQRVKDHLFIATVRATARAMSVAIDSARR